MYFIIHRSKCFFIIKSLLHQYYFIVIVSYEEDSGVYTCQVRSDSGHTASSASLMVLNKVIIQTLECTHTQLGVIVVIHPQNWCEMFISKLFGIQKISYYTNQ